MSKKKNGFIHRCSCGKVKKKGNVWGYPRIPLDDFISRCQRDYGYTAVVIMNRPCPEHENSPQRQ